MDNKNTSKNTGGVTGKGFDVSGQPSAESKKAGWARRREGLAFMDKITEYMDFSLYELEELENSMQKNKDNYSVREMLAMNYLFKVMKSDKYLLHFIDLHIPKPQYSETLEEEKKKPTKLIVEIVGGNSQNPHP